MLTDDPECRLLFHGKVAIDFSRLDIPPEKSSEYTRRLLGYGISVRGEGDRWQCVLYQRPTDVTAIFDAYGVEEMTFDIPFYASKPFRVDSPESEYNVREWRPQYLITPMK